MLNLLIQASSRYPIHRKKIREVIETTLQKMGVHGDVEVELNIIGDRKMTQLHVKYLHEEGTTDVLSFPLHHNALAKFGIDANRIVSQLKSPYVKYLAPSPDTTAEDNEFITPDEHIVRLGTIFVSYPQAQHQANQHRLLIDDEINQLVEHGMYHLLGIHHE